MDFVDVCYLPATEMLQRFRDKSLSPVEVMEATIRRIEQVEPEINALTHTFFDAAREQARRAENNYAKGRGTGALEGLPVGIKDESPVEGMPCTNGSLILKDDVAAHTAVNNRRILDAGGIIHARTATPEFSCSGVTHSRLWGVTRNPWNPKFTPRAGRPAARRRRSRRRPPPSPPAPTSAARSASPHRPAGSPASSRPMAGTRKSRPSISTCTATPAPWRVA